jgi:hypothetical protein
MVLFFFTGVEGSDFLPDSTHPGFIILTFGQFFFYKTFLPEKYPVGFLFPL